MSNKILIIGSGGREHALAWKLAQSPKISKIYIAPGNAGTAQVGENINIKADDFPALIDFAKKEKIYLTIVGPDDPLALGIVDQFQNQGLKIWGPTKKAAQIEASKSFAKELMSRMNIPTADYKVFTKFDEAIKYVEQYYSPPPHEEGLGEVIANVNASSKPTTTPSNSPSRGGENPKIVIKASGLALGKGVTVCQTLDEAKATLKKAMIDKIFGEAGNQVIIEEYLQGPEYSIHAFCDGETFQLLPASQDHKPAFDGNKGPNTGGMGTIAPVPWVTQEILNDVAQRIVEPTLEGLKKLDSPFVGLLYPGLMQTQDVPKVLEFNARFGDPETQSYMRLLKTDLFDIIEASLNGKLNDINIEWLSGFACCIVLASGGYPGAYEKGKEITGIDEAEKMDDIVVFHAGTIIKDGKLVTNGGRVLGVTAVADDLKIALSKAYTAVKLIKFDGMHYRKDIGAKSLALTDNN
jgi:phosphoribosylamine--glycine ligase